MIKLGVMIMVGCYTFQVGRAHFPKLWAALYGVTLSGLPWKDHGPHPCVPKKASATMACDQPSLLFLIYFGFFLSNVTWNAFSLLLQEFFKHKIHIWRWDSFLKKKNNPWRLMGVHSKRARIKNNNFQSKTNAVALSPSKTPGVWFLFKVFFF